MTIPTITSPPTPGPNKYGGDPVAFDAAMQARLNWQETATQEEAAMVAWVNARATEVSSLAAATQADRVLAQAAQTAVTAQSPQANAAAAAAAAAAAQGYAALAQATNPDSPIRLNSRVITATLTIPADYNAHSVGPLAVADGIAVTVSDHSTWSIT